jgi:signal transduction histidine kinase
VINGDLPSVAYDRDRIVQVISNLVGNASKVGARTITLGASANIDEVEFWVADDGPGNSF